MKFIFKSKNILLYFIMILLSSYSAWCDDTLPTPSNKIAIHILVDDNTANTLRDNEFYKKLFQKLRPDIEFREIIVNKSRKSNKKIFLELKSKINNILNEQEKVSYLLISTHGSTKDSHSGFKTTSRYTSAKFMNRG